MNEPSLFVPDVFSGTDYCDSLTAYSRRKTIPVRIGDLWLGSDYPIRVQSMTTIDTMDTSGSVEQSIRMIEAGCELVRITAPSVKEAQNLDNIRKELRRRGYNTPICADIHFTPNAAELAARLVEKVRINPGNYADKKRFEVLEYTESEYQAEIQRIRDKFLPLVKICKEYGTAMRIGTNHGSLSDRILSRYGDTPNGMVESALEFLRICEDEGYTNLVISMKSSNPQVMVEAYRLLAKRLKDENLQPYPLHLGVTEAGEGEDGRVKSAMGIGTLLEDGLGDTIRVSLTEDPEFEIPVAQALVRRYDDRASKATPIPAIDASPVNPFAYHRRETAEVGNFGGKNVPRIIADFSGIRVQEPTDLQTIGHFYLPATDKWAMNDLGADYLYTGAAAVPFMLPNGLKQIVDFQTWKSIDDQEHTYPLLNREEYLAEVTKGFTSLHFLRLTLAETEGDILSYLQEDPLLVLVITTTNAHAMPELRRLFFRLIQNRIHLPVVIQWEQPSADSDESMLFAATDCGGLLVDGLGDGLLLRPFAGQEDGQVRLLNSLGFGILQAARTRMSKTEYISCPSCGRTLFDLQETTALIRKRTDHLKGVKIGIMGCIVNGPGEMADADYGYVGMGVNKIALYRGQQLVKRSVSADKALDELIELMREDGVWREPEAAALQQA
ncbi:(E)-4-hydroxy-3-methylbut-2-enyl-diphosphate synthase [Siphonobacter aquaeclarae]|uniref:4-hydroxy-3-methylbut-2-en-1-yl diphosphate synthase (flavodoxin) n=1 Tax=Siphonobacter aquaeclarae TaxID=563176 RepID=A0A1G9RV71_9BACT|nr:(E)-4-hydroxy-3-methylbut-2-enyl-diphosphate synthase [Siphonobacter aquaeclarae]SDM27188.1 4-hydroxy-3-methylbut-2-en-1-yl diphosphate synthase [Siphonobacter aquaeclarae]